MKKVKEFIKKIDYRHYISIAILACVLILTILFRQDNYVSIGKAFRNLFDSFLYLFSAKKEAVTYTPPSEIIATYNLPTEPLKLAVNFKVYSMLFINWDFIVLYLIDVLFFVLNLMKFIIWLPIIILLVVIIRTIILRQKKQENKKDSKILLGYLKAEEKVINPVINWISSFVSFFVSKYGIFALFFILLLTNAISILINIVAWNFTFVKSFNLTSLFNLLLYITIDVIKALTYDMWLIIILTIALVFYLRKRSAINRLEQMQEINEQRAVNLGIATLVTAPPGTGKTTLVSSMTVDIDKMFRNKAFDIIKKYQLYFPNFKWDELEEFIKEEVKEHRVVNRAQLKKTLNDIWNNYTSGKINNFFNYDTKLYPLIIHNGVNYISLVEAVIPYAEAYFLYFSGKPLAFGNYSIKFYYKKDGYFPLYDYDYLNFDKKDDYKFQFINIANFDSRRILNKLNNEDDATWYQMDGQIESYTEIDKERGNRDDYIGMDKNDFEANQRNDGFNKSIKLTRHEFTIDNEPFTRVLVDCQREYSVNADLRETCEDRIRIKERSETKTALPLFFIEYITLKPLVKGFQNYYYQYRSLRNDKTLYNYLFLKFIYRISSYLTKVENLYSYSQLLYKHEIGATATEPGRSSLENYFFIYQKVYSGLFATDAYSEFFESKRLEAKEGFIDAKQYSTVKPSVNELKEQESYWINELISISNLKNNKKGKK